MEIRRDLRCLNTTTAKKDGRSRPRDLSAYNTNSNNLKHSYPIKLSLATVNAAAKAQTTYEQSGS